MPLAPPVTTATGGSEGASPPPSLADAMTGDGTARPIDRGYAMPPEWHRHRRTWMAFPRADYALEGGKDAFEAWSAVANTIARYEPVTVVVDPDVVAEARARLAP